MPVDFDHVVAGAGLSGLLLARALLRQPGTGRDQPRILLADPRPSDDRPLTYAFWARRPGLLHRWRIVEWDSLHVVGRDGQTTTLPLTGWRYTAIDWARARAELLDEVTNDARVTFVPEAIDDVQDRRESASVVLRGASVSGRWVYDSRPPLPAAGRPSPDPGPARLQVFRGLWVSTEKAIDTSAATLLDFSADQGDDLGFAYALPTSHDTALVMAVRMGRGVAEPDPVPALGRVVGSGSWTALAEESGATPLLSPPPRRRLGGHALAIGVRGGRARPSTGYAVQRILVDTEAICRSLARHGHPFDIPNDPRWQTVLDAVWLRALDRERAGLEPAFAALLTRAPVDSVLCFLDGQPRARDIAAVVRALPPEPFLRALVG